MYVVMLKIPLAKCCLFPCFPFSSINMSLISFKGFFERYYCFIFELLLYSVVTPHL